MKVWIIILIVWLIFTISQAIVGNWTAFIGGLGCSWYALTDLAKVINTKY